jgi:putative alpha-1,2-mannosidase
LRATRAAGLALLFATVACGGEGETSLPVRFARESIYSRRSIRASAPGATDGASARRYPGQALPFAMIHPSPDTRTASGAASFYHCPYYAWT